MRTVDKILEALEEADLTAEDVERVRDALHLAAPTKVHPVDRVRWIPINLVEPNDYNPNSVAKPEMQLLHTSVSHDGYTQPVVTVWDPDREKYVIVDGFHRYSIMRNFEDIRETTGGLLPVVVIDKAANDRMASTVRHNRARGKHSMKGMANMVFEMLKNGWGDADVCNELGMSPDELVRIKHITGFSKLFEKASYGKAWETPRQVKSRVEYYKEHPDEADPMKSSPPEGID